MNWNELNRLLLGGMLCGALLTAGKIHAEEEPSQVLTSISSSTLSGVIETTQWTASLIVSTPNELPSQRGTMPMPLEIATQPGSFAGATTPPNTVETTLYFSPLQHSSNGSVAMAPFEIGSDGPYPMPIELSGAFGSFAYNGAGWAFNPSTGIISGPSIPVEPNTTIPEPSTIALFLGGAGLLAIRMRRKA